MPQQPSRRRDPVAVARGFLIKAERQRQGLTQERAAFLITAKLHEIDPDARFSRPHLADLESGRRGMSEQKLRAIAAVLGIEEAQLRIPLVLRSAA